MSEGNIPLTSVCMSLGNVRCVLHPINLRLCFLLFGNQRNIGAFFAFPGAIKQVARSHTVYFRRFSWCHLSDGDLCAPSFPSPTPSLREWHFVSCEQNWILWGPWAQKGDKCSTALLARCWAVRAEKQMHGGLGHQMVTSVRLGFAFLIPLPGSSCGNSEAWTWVGTLDCLSKSGSGTPHPKPAYHVESLLKMEIPRS